MRSESTIPQMSSHLRKHVGDLGKTVFTDQIAYHLGDLYYACARTKPLIEQLLHTDLKTEEGRRILSHVQAELTELSKHSEGVVRLVEGLALSLYEEAATPD